jgi:hypothetical protein
LTIDSGTAGVLQASDLVRARVSATVAIFAEEPYASELELKSRGVHVETRAERTERELNELGITKVLRIPYEVAGSEDEATVLSQWGSREGFRTVVVICQRDHSRRLARMARRASKGYRMEVLVQPARYSAFDPDSWWKSRRGLRTGIVELQKLLLDILRHPLG